MTKTEFNTETGQTKPRPLPRSSPREPPPPPPVNESNLRTRLSSSLDTKLGTLRKEMVICFKINEFLEMQLKVKVNRINKNIVESLKQTLIVHYHFFLFDSFNN